MSVFKTSLIAVNIDVKMYDSANIAKPKCNTMFSGIGGNLLNEWYDCAQKNPSHSV